MVHYCVVVCLSPSETVFGTVNYITRQSAVVELKKLQKYKVIYVYLLKIQNVLLYYVYRVNTVGL